MISIIVAVAQNGVIGCHNKLIWHISEDLKHFKQITTSHPVIMGRKTFESIGKTLPNRENVIITRQNDYVVNGAKVVNSLTEAINLFDKSQEIFVIGGGEIYNEAIKIADKIYLTEVYRDYDGDTFFPNWDRTQWNIIDRQDFQSGQNYDGSFSFIEYERK